MSTPTVHYVEPDAKVLEPITDYSGVSTFDGNVFVFDSDVSGGYSRSDDTRVEGGKTIGENSRGTVFYLHQNGNGAVQWLKIDHVVDEADVVCDLHAEADTGGFINANRIEGRWQWTRVGVHTRGTGDIFGNEFDVDFQPHNDNTQSAWLHENGRINVWLGEVWDSWLCDDAWDIRAGAGSNNVLYSRDFNMVKSNVTDEVGDSTNVARTGRVTGQGTMDLETATVHTPTLNGQRADRHYELLRKIEPGRMVLNESIDLATAGSIDYSDGGNEIQVDIHRLDTTGNAPAIQMAVDNHTAMDYESVTRSVATLASSTGDTEWTLVNPGSSFEGAGGTWHLARGRGTSLVCDSRPRSGAVASGRPGRRAARFSLRGTSAWTMGPRSTPSKSLLTTTRST